MDDSTLIPSCFRSYGRKEIPDTALHFHSSNRFHGKPTGTSNRSSSVLRHTQVFFSRAIDPSRKSSNFLRLFFYND
ncbi:unnamed protein product [Cuscuta campestris]|uniref:Uncharacterized protein n=1 Tax=Cuscuta campestris TaxID=132261 RepID=A0A484K999_9ASTE|nr:unnamed protein product [Cuscuta campestris]